MTTACPRTFKQQHIFLFFQNRPRTALRNQTTKFTIVHRFCVLRLLPGAFSIRAGLYFRWALFCFRTLGGILQAGLTEFWHSLVAILLEDRRSARFRPVGSVQPMGDFFLLVYCTGNICILVETTAVRRTKRSAKWKSQPAATTQKATRKARRRRGAYSLLQ